MKLIQQKEEEGEGKYCLSVRFAQSGVAALSEKSPPVQHHSPYIIVLIFPPLKSEKWTRPALLSMK